MPGAREAPGVVVSGRTAGGTGEPAQPKTAGVPRAGGGRPMCSRNAIVP
jgi:hypothetical protein